MIAIDAVQRDAPDLPCRRCAGENRRPRGLQVHIGSREARVRQGVDPVDGCGGAAAGIDDHQRTILGGRREARQVAARIDGRRQRRGDIGGRVSGQDRVVVGVASQRDAPCLGRDRRAGEDRGPSTRRCGIADQCLVAAVIRRRHRYAGRKGAGGGLDDDEAAALDGRDVIGRRRRRVDPVRQSPRDRGQGVVADDGVGEAQCGRQRHGPCLADHRRTDQLDGNGAAGRSDVVEICGVVERRSEAGLGQERGEAGTGALDDDQRVARRDGVEAGQSVDAVGEDRGQRLGAVGDKVGVLGDARGQRCRTPLECNRRQPGRAVGQYEVGTFGPGTERYPGEGVDAVGQRQHDIRQAVAGDRGIACRPHEAGIADGHRPDFARHRRRSPGCQRRLREVTRRIDAGEGGSPGDPVGFADRQVEARIAAHRQRPDLARLRRTGEGHGRRPRRVSHRRVRHAGDRNGRRRRRTRCRIDGEGSRPPCRTVTADDRELLAFGHCRQYDRPGGVDRPGEYLGDVLTSVGDDAEVCRADRHTEADGRSARCTQGDCPGLACGRGALERSDESLPLDRDARERAGLRDQRRGVDEGCAPPRAVRADDHQPVAFRRRHQRGYGPGAYGVDHAREDFSDVLPGVGDNREIAASDRYVEVLAGTVRSDQGQSPGLASDRGDVEDAPKRGRRRGIDRVVARRGDGELRHERRSGGDIDDDQGRPGGGRSEGIRGVEANRGGQGFGNRGERGRRPARRDGVGPAGKRHGPLFTCGPVAGSDRVVGQGNHRRGSTRRDRLRRGRNHRNRCVNRHAVAIHNDQRPALVRGRVGGRKRVVDVHQVSKRLRDVVQGIDRDGVDRRADCHRVIPAGQRERPGFVRNRVAAQCDGRGARRRRIDCRHAARCDRKARGEGHAADAEDLQAAGHGVGRKGVRRIRIDLVGEFVEHRLQHVSGRRKAVAGDGGAGGQREGPGLVGNDRGDGDIKGRCHGCTCHARRSRGIARARGEGAVGGLDDEQVRSARHRRECRGIRIDGVVDQRRQGGRDLRCGIARHRGVGHRRNGTAARNREVDSELVAGANDTACNRSRLLRCRGRGQGPCRRHRVGRSECRAGAIDDEHLPALDNGGQIGLGLRVDRCGEAGRDFCQRRAGRGHWVAYGGGGQGRP